MMKVTGDYVPLHMETVSRLTLPSGHLRLGTLPEPPHYALEVYRDGILTVYRGPCGQIVDKFRAEYDKA